MTGVDWLKPGALYPDLSAEDYHSDPCKTPSLSAGIAKLLLDRSPLHAWTAHPALNPDHQPEEKDSFDLGSVAHVLLLEGEQFADRVEVVDAPDWRTKAAQQQRADARDEGLIPILAKHWTRTQDMVHAVRAQLGRAELPIPFTEGKAEQTLIWEEDGGVLCRARLDWLRNDHTYIDDFKSTSASANPHVYSRRTFWSIGCDVQSAFYLRGAQKVLGREPTWRYIVGELEPPYAISVLSPHESVLELGRRKVDLAIRKWRDCLESGLWPSYPVETALVELDAWQEADWARLEYEEGAAA